MRDVMEGFEVSQVIPLEERLLNIESAVAHLQHDYEQLHQVSLDLQHELRALHQLVLRIENRVDRLHDDPEVRSPEAERPPHY
jgi:SlyX protein